MPTSILFACDCILYVLAFIGMLLFRFDPALFKAALQLHSEIILLFLSTTILFFFIFNLYEDSAVTYTLFTLERQVVAVLSASLMGILFLYMFHYPTTPKTNIGIVSLLFLMFDGSLRLYFSRFKAIDLIKTVGFWMEMPARVYLEKSILKNTLYHTTGLYQKHETLPDILVIDAPLASEEIELCTKGKTSVVSPLALVELLERKIPLDFLSAQEASLLLGRTETWSASLSRLLDITFSLVVLIVLSPLLLIASIVIYCEDGAPIVYQQPRVGHFGQIFQNYKLRTMRKVADETKEIEKRITKSGRILRALHIDEIPQLWNVLVGDIALVGPRPEFVAYANEYAAQIPFYALRHIVKPGFTGWAQISYHASQSVSEAREKLEYDLYYIAHKDFLFDITILVKTMHVFLRRRRHEHTV